MRKKPYNYQVVQHSAQLQEQLMMLTSKELNIDTYLEYVLPHADVDRHSEDYMACLTSHVICWGLDNNIVFPVTNHSYFIPSDVYIIFTSDDEEFIYDFIDMTQDSIFHDFICLDTEHVNQLGFIEDQPRGVFLIGEKDIVDGTLSQTFIHALSSVKIDMDYPKEVQSHISIEYTQEFYDDIDKQEAEAEAEGMLMLLMAYEGEMH